MPTRTKNRLSRRLLTVTILTVSCALPASALAFNVPTNDGFVTDAANLLKPAEKQTLETELNDYKQQSSNEIAVVTVPTIGDSALEDVSLQIARAWGIGTKEHNNGILILVAYQERKVRIEVGYGLEGAVPDIVAKGIIDTDITPHFRDGDYYGGIEQAIDSLKKHIGGEYTAERYNQQPTFPVFSIYGLFIIIVIIQWMISVMSRTKSWWLGGVFGGIGGVILSVVFAWWLSIPILIVLGLVLDYVISKNYKSRSPTRWWAGGGWGPGGGGSWGGGSSGGGFSGGSFGGGGSSGGW